MKTLNEMIEIIRLENPDGLRVGNDEQGYTLLDAQDYESTIVQWANARLEKETRLANAEAIVEAKKEAIIKLTELGIDPKAFDLQTPQSTPIVTADE